MRTMVKMRPMVGTTHAALDALDMILAKRPAKAEDIDRIEIGIVEWAIPHGAAIVHPHDMLSAQFSLAFAVALLVIYGRTSINDIGRPDLWIDAAIMALAERVDPVAIEVPADACELCGRATAFQPAPRGYPTNPASEAQIMEKFFDVVDGVLSSEQAQSLADMVAQADTLPRAAALLDLVAGS